MKRSLHIADPCTETWEEMPGTDARRFCGKCGKHVHSLSAMNRVEAERLIASARSGALCVRVEHTKDGAVHFKKEEQGGLAARARPMVSAAVGASLLVASCSRAEPVVTLEPPAIAPDTAMDVSAPAADARPASPTGADLDKKDDACAPGGGAPTAAPAKAKGPARPAATRQDGESDRQVTMGCLCAPGDAVCDCL